jgi:hypothetical protein
MNLNMHEIHLVITGCLPHMLNRIQQILKLQVSKPISDETTLLNPGTISNTPSEPVEPALEDNLNEAPISKILETGGKIARSLDFSKNPNDPDVQISGYGSVSLSRLKTDIRADLVRLGDSIGGTDAKYLMLIMSDFAGKKVSGNLVAFKMAGLAEVEEFMQQPNVKRKITMMKRV